MISYHHLKYALLFNHKFNLIFSSYYKRNILYAKDCWLFKKIDW